MQQLNLVVQVIFWGLLGLWFWGVRIPFMEQIIGAIAFIVALLLVVH